MSSLITFVSPTPPLPAAGLPRRPLPALLACGLLALLVVIVVAGLNASAGARAIWIDLCLIAMFVLIGYGVKRRLGGALIDARNLMSLSRLQMVVWTVLILGAYLAYVFARISRNDPNPVDVEADWHLWALLGISTASLVGSPLVLGTKTDQTPDVSAVVRTASATDESPGTVAANSNGLVYINSSSEDASIADIFQGDEVGNTTQVDLAKVQMFLFTFIVGIAFLASVLSALSDPKNGLDQMPALSDGAVWLLGISHAGYLSSKGVTHTKTQ